jgi:bifunctional dethiobiotin synthetase / adenosylmethionine---8-amino-7-oxononanoate aminotransferase
LGLSFLNLSFWGLEGCYSCEFFFVPLLSLYVRSGALLFGWLLMKYLFFLFPSDPLFQRTLVKVVRRSPHLFGKTSLGADDDDDGETATSWTGLPVIFDEVFTGLYRLGCFSAASFLGVDADISVHAKLLTGGLVPLCATLASESIFRAFESDDKSDALLHGHSYTAHAVGCQVALESIKEMQRMEKRGDWDWAKATRGWNSMPSSTSTIREDDGLESQVEGPSTTTAAAAAAAAVPQPPVWSVWDCEFVDWISRQTDRSVYGVWALGSVLVIHMKAADGATGYKSNAARELQAALFKGASEGVGVTGSGWNVHSRVLGNVLYIMAGQKTKEETILLVEYRLREALERGS